LKKKIKRLPSRKPKKRKSHQLTVKEKEAAEEELDAREENGEAEKEVNTVVTEEEIEAIEEVAEEEDQTLPLTPRKNSS
jgi:hypothetical protein